MRTEERPYLMAHVVLPDFLQAHTGKRRDVEVNAESYSELIASFEREAPGFEALVSKKATAVIDGEIVPDPMFDDLREDSEVCFLPKLSAG